MKIGNSIIALVAAAAVLLMGAVADAGQDRETGNSLKKLGFKFYWSLLDADQQLQAKELIADHLAETAADRLSAVAKLTGFRAEVARVLTRSQLRELGRIKRAMRALPRAKRAAVFDRLLDTIDRAAFTDRVARLADAGPGERVRIGLELVDQMMDMYLKAYGPRLELTREQETRIREHYADLRSEIEPAAHRLAEARAKLIEDALAILTPEQRDRVGEFKDTVMEKILGWLRN